MKRLFIRLMALFVLTNSLAIVYSSPEAFRHPIHYILTLSEDSEGLYCKPNATDDPIYMAFESALLSKQLIVANPTILHWLAKRTMEGRDGKVVSWLQRLDGVYQAFQAKTEDFVVLVPKEMGSSLEALGLNKDALQAPFLTAAAMEDFFGHNKFKTQPIIIDHFSPLFIPKTDQHDVCAKFFSVVGHGLDSLDDREFIWSKAVVAQLEVYQLVQLLQVFEAINTRSVYLVSCYTPGKNLLKLQNLLSGRCNDERCPLKSALTYPLFIQGTTDMPTSLVFGHYCSFPSLMEEIREWEAGDYKDQSLLSKGMNNLFQNVPSDDRFFNYPLVRMPGKKSTFKALALSTTAVICAIEQVPKTIEVPEGVDALQCYPADMHNITFHMTDSSLPGFVSRVTGAAHHFIGSLVADAKGDLITILTKCFLNGMATDDGDLCAGLADKAWFIREIISADEKIAQGIVVRKGCLKKASIELEAVYCDAKGDYYCLRRLVKSMENHEISVNRIDQGTYVKTVQRIFWETMPGEDAVVEAMDGRESIADHELLLKKFGQMINIALAVADSPSLIREDMAKIRSGTLDKKMYINYAAYSCDKAIIKIMMEEFIAGQTFDKEDIEQLLFHLVDHEYISLIFDPIKQLAEEEQLILLPSVVAVFSYLLDKSLYAQAMQAYDDIIHCARTALKSYTPTRQHKGLLMTMQHELSRLMVLLVQQSGADQAVERVLALLNDAELGMQGFGLVLIQAMQGAGFTNARLESHRGFIAAIAMRLEQAVQEGNLVAAFFSQQAMVKTYSCCLNRS